MSVLEEQHRSLGLKQVHEIITGLLISSAESGRLVDTLSLLVNPREISPGQIEKLNPEYTSLVLCSTKNSLTGDVEWHSYRYRKIMSSDPVAYFISGLSAFPLPIWPFFSERIFLSPIEHFIDYISAYHASFEAQKVSDRAMFVRHNQNLLFLAFNEQKDSFVTAFSSFEESFSFGFSCYTKDFGAIVVSSKELVRNSGDPLIFGKKLSSLQYEGKLDCHERRISSFKKHYRGLFYMPKGNNKWDLANSFFLKVASDCDKIIDCNSALLSIKSYCKALFK